MFCGQAGFITLLSLLCRASHADTLVEESSFGYRDTISPNHNSIPHFTISGDDHTPQQLSNKVILTPLYPGNLRTSVWADQTNAVPGWRAEFEFRASGPDRGSGNLQLWYAKDGQTTIGTNSVYTVGKFEGLAILIDNQGSRGGSIRGFLNDGSTEYRSHPHIDGLAFGHCDYSYRNLGRPSRLQLVQSKHGFEVLIDDARCFVSDKIELPKFYSFGITAATSETPDSFEAFKFVLTAIDIAGSTIQNQNQNQDQKSLNNQQQTQRSSFNLGGASPPTDPDDNSPASNYRTSDAQFADLHNRLQMMSHSVLNVVKELQAHSRREEERYQELLRKIPSTDTITSVDRRISALERTVDELKREIQRGDHGERFDRLERRVSEIHSTVRNHVPEAVGQCKCLCYPPFYRGADTGGSDYGISAAYGILRWSHCGISNASSSELLGI